MRENETSKRLSPLFKKPVGASGSEYHWESFGTTRGVICEICGTIWPENPDGVGIDTFLGRQVISECCGKIIDIAYQENKIAFAGQFLDEAVANPTEYPWFWSILKEKLAKARTILEKNSQCIETAQNNLLKLNQVLSDK